MNLKPTTLQQYVNSSKKNTFDVSPIMIGVVVNSDDPQQMGRLQVSIPSINSNPIQSSAHPWVSYGSPYGGVSYDVPRGPGAGESTRGPVAYGLWAIPKEGTRVIVCAVDNDPNQLYWIGCIYPNSIPHTMPHGRHSSKFEDGDYVGPRTSVEDESIYPLYSNQQAAFTSNGKTPDINNYEWLSRGIDYSAAAAIPARVSDTDPDSRIASQIPDDQDTEITLKDGTTRKFRQGYSERRTQSNDGTVRLESSTVGLTSPGFHAFSMDDREENCRMRFRTTGGHQIILDDTNERLYISTNEGKNYVEMDANGHIFVYSQESISLRSEGDLNFTADKTVRITGKEGVHVESGGELRVHSMEDIYIRGDESVFTEVTDNHNIRVGGDTFTDVVGTMNFNSANNHIQISGEYHISSGSTIFSTVGTYEIGSSNITVDASGHVKAIGDIKSDGDVVSSSYSLNQHQHTYQIPVHVAGPGQTSATDGTSPVSSSPASPSTPQLAYDFNDDEVDLAYWTNIVPSHEPWARTMIDDYRSNINHIPELTYDDPNINQKMSKVKTHTRGDSWHR